MVVTYQAGIQLSMNAQITKDVSKRGSLLTATKGSDFVLGHNALHVFEFSLTAVFLLSLCNCYCARGIPCGALTRSMSGKDPVFLLEWRRVPFTVTSKSPAHITSHA